MQLHHFHVVVSGASGSSIDRLQPRLEDCEERYEHDEHRNRSAESQTFAIASRAQQIDRHKAWQPLP